MGKLDRIMGIVLAALMVITLPAAMQSGGVFDCTLRTQNVYELSWDSLYGQMVSGMGPEGDDLYVQNEGMEISFYAGGSLRTLNLRLFAPKSFLGVRYYNCYEGILRNGKLHVTKESNISAKEFNDSDRAAAIDGWSFFEGLDQLWIEPMLEEYTVDTPSYYTLGSAGTGRSAEASGGTESSVFLYVPTSAYDGFDMRQFDTHTTLRSDCIYYVFTPMYRQGQDGGYRGDHAIIPFVDKSLVG